MRLPSSPPPRTPFVGGKRARRDASERHRMTSAATAADGRIGASERGPWRSSRERRTRSFWGLPRRSGPSPGAPRHPQRRALCGDRRSRRPAWRQRRRCQPAVFAPRAPGSRPRGALARPFRPPRRHQPDGAPPWRDPRHMAAREVADHTARVVVDQWAVARRASAGAHAAPGRVCRGGANRRSRFFGMRSLGGWMWRSTGPSGGELLPAMFQCGILGGAALGRFWWRSISGVARTRPEVTREGSLGELLRNWQTPSTGFLTTKLSLWCRILSKSDPGALISEARRLSGPPSGGLGPHLGDPPDRPRESSR